MIEISVKFFASISEILGVRETTISLDECNFQELLKKLKQKYGEKFQQTIFQPNGTIRESFRILLNENSMYEQDLIEIEFKDNDIIAFLPPIGGGC